MEIRVDKLRAKISLLQTVVPKNTTLPITHNILCENGKMTALDLEKQVTLNVPEVGGDRFLLPARLVLDLIKYVPGDLMVNIEAKDKTVKMTWDGGKGTFYTVDAKDFPEMRVEKPISNGTLDGDIFIGALKEALVYAATEEDRAVLTGVNLRIGEVALISGADGFRMSFQSLKLDYPANTDVTFPGKTVSVLDKFWTKAPGQPAGAATLIDQLFASRPLHMVIGEGNASFQFGDTFIVTSLISGHYPDTLALMNTFKEGNKIQFFGTDLYNAVKRLMGVAREGTQITRMKWDEKTLTVYVQAEEIGEIETDVPLLSSTGPGRIAVKASFLLDYLVGKQGVVELGTETRSSPLIFHFGNRPYVSIMPMFVQWEDEPTPAEATKANQPAEASPASAPEATEGNSPVEPEDSTEAESEDTAEEEAAEEPETEEPDTTPAAVVEPEESVSNASYGITPNNEPISGETANIDDKQLELTPAAAGTQPEKTKKKGARKPKTSQQNP